MQKRADNGTGEKSLRNARAVVLVCAGLLLVIYVVLIQQPARPPDSRAPTPSPSPPPDFAAFTDVKAKKRAFFNWLRPQVNGLNDELLAQRARLKKLRKRIADQQRLSSEDHDWLMDLARDAGVELASPPGESDLNTLLERVDAVPASLVLAQAAIESGWGTSRFAREANNYFGLWCFTPGCGVEPNQRASGKAHEVQRFTSPLESIRSYLTNINTHPAYQSLRTLRAELRAADKPLHGCVLAKGLMQYSERGQAYVDEVRHFIRYNKLSPHGSAPCQQQTGKQ